MKRRALLLVVNLALFLLTGLASSWDGTWTILLISALPLLYSIRIVAQATRRDEDTATEKLSKYRPFVTILIPAKNEELVIGRAVRSLLSLRYHNGDKPNYEIIVIDDDSTDRTFDNAYKAAGGVPNVRVLRRSSVLPSGKAAALNWALPHCHGQVIGVFDADAQVLPDFLEATIPLLVLPEVGALQVRKQIINPGSPFQQGPLFTLSARLRKLPSLLSLQEAEMVVDAIFQAGRGSMGGGVELRGNGQLVKRQVLDAVLGWNDETIVDDLDLTTRLYSQGYRVVFCHNINVWEEGVVSWQALWHQRVRWAQGSICRYLDYADRLTQAKLPLWLKTDIFLTTIEFIGPAAFFYSLLWWLISAVWGLSFHPSIALAPLVAAFSVLYPMTIAALRLLLPGEWRIILIGSWLAFFYLFHWWPVILWSMLRIVLTPDKLVWHKSEHLGLGSEV